MVIHSLCGWLQKTLKNHKLGGYLSAGRQKIVILAARCLAGAHTFA